MKSFVRDTLQTAPKSIFTLSVEGGATQVQIHGDHNANIGQGLFTYTESFDAALKLTYGNGALLGDHHLLEDLFSKIAGWCFDGSMNQLH